MERVSFQVVIFFQEKVKKNQMKTLLHNNKNFHSIWRDEIRNKKHLLNLSTIKLLIIKKQWLDGFVDIGMAYAMTWK